MGMKLGGLREGLIIALWGNRRLAYLQQKHAAQCNRFRGARHQESGSKSYRF